MTSKLKEFTEERFQELKRGLLEEGRGDQIASREEWKDALNKMAKTLKIEPKIKSATIGPMPDNPKLVKTFSTWTPMPTVNVIFEDDTKKELFSFYPDEIMFTEEELIGKTETEARRLFFEKDKAYLRS